MNVHQVVPARIETHDDTNRKTNKRAVPKNKAKKMILKQKRPFIISALTRTSDDTVFTYEHTVHSETIGILLNVSH